MKLGLILLISILLIPIGFAKPGHAMGGPKGNPHGHFGVAGPGALPPGLRHKGMPVGLERRGMTPRGWSRGKAYWKSNSSTIRKHKINKRR